MTTTDAKVAMMARRSFHQCGKSQLVVQLTTISSDTTMYSTNKSSAVFAMPTNIEVNQEGLLGSWSRT